MKSKPFLFLLAILLYLGCGDEDSLTPATKIEGSLFVTVYEVDGRPVPDAFIEIGEQTGITDEDGTFFFTAVTLTGDDFLKVDKSGYFRGSRRFQAKEAHTQFVSITLLPKTEIGMYNSAQQATIPIDNKSRLTFPAHAVVRANGSAYNGIVHVLASPIYGDDPQLSEKMPGSLTGVDLSGENIVLSSLGMLAVELQADNGEVLQVATGKTVEMQLAIADQQISNAPATIPMWYFDEALGYWVQEGEAIRQANVYIAQLPHFTFWNCDVPNTLVNWEARFVYGDGSPAQNTKVCLTVQSLNDQRCGNTNANGVIYGQIPMDEVMGLKVLDECGELIYARNLGAFSKDVTMDAIALEDTDLSSVEGTVLQCDGLPLTSGFVTLRTPRRVYVYPVQGPDGHFEGSYLYCEGDVLTLEVYDIVNELKSLPHFVSYDRDLDAGELKACDQVEEYIRYKITGFSRVYTYYLVEMASPNITRIEALDSIGVKGRFGWTFDGTTIGQYKGYTMHGNQINLPNGQVGYVLKMDLNVTEYGGPGEFVRGTFSGRINAGGNGSGGPGQSDFNGTFSVRNE